MSSGREADRRARSAAQTVFDRPVMLEAGAGTGKTTTLVARTLCWCLGEGWDRGLGDLEGESPSGHEVATEVLQGVVAITFTEAAAAEMASRIAASLASIVDGHEESLVGVDLESLPGKIPVAERRRRATRLLESFDYLTVGTIHAFCYGLLKSYPLDAGLHPELTVDADGNELESVARLVVERWSQQAYADSESPLLTLAGEGIGPGRLLEAVVRWTAEGPPIDVLENDPLDDESVVRFLTDLKGRADALRAVLADHLSDLDPDLLARRTESAIEATAARLGDAATGGATSLEATLEGLAALWPDNVAGRLRDWGRGRLPTAGERQRLDGLGEPFAEAARALVSSVRTALSLDSGLLRAARLSLLPLLREVAEELRARGSITFSGLLRETLRLLERSPAVLRRERRRLRLLLVDEFQDTDPVQSAIVRLLALEGDASERPSLFVVGDPKQSIYAWRDADLGAYEAFEGALVADGGEVHSLDLNFRSTPAVLEEVERVIEPVMHYERGVQPGFHSLVAAHRRGDDPALARGLVAPVEHWLSWRADGETGRLGPVGHAESLELEAEAVAADIERLHDAGEVPWSRIALLFRTSLPQPAFLDELRRRDVPFAITRDRNYYQRREIIEAAAWVRAIVHPTDHLALLTVLRSVVVGVPDAALVPLWSRSLPKLATELSGPGDLDSGRVAELVREAADAIPEGVPGLDRVAGWEQSLLTALTALARLRRSYRRDPADVFVRELRRELLVEVSEGARFQGKFRLANLSRFFRQLESALDAEEADVHSILRSLRLGVMEGRAAEEAMPRDAAEDAVQVMTIHTAKGLEFDHVYVVQLHAGTRSGGNEIVEAHEVEPGRWQYHLFGAPTLGYELAEARRERIEAAETVRTLYVAMTRACQRIVLVGVWPEPLRRKQPSRARTYMELLQHRRHLGDSMLAAANDPSALLRGGWEEGGARWRVLGGVTEMRTERRRAAAPAWLPSPERVARWLDAREHRVEAMARRMDRPWSRPATHETSALLEASEGPAEAAGGGRQRIAASRQLAMDVGTALHSCLEDWDPAREPERELERQQRRLRRLLGEDPERLARAEALLERFAGGELVERLMAIAPAILGREIPLLLRSDAGEGEPVHCHTGAIDLLYRDPQDGTLVVADYKTDHVEAGAELEERAHAYHPQEGLYARTVERAMALEAPPRTELWFLWAGVIVPGAPGGT